MIAKKKEREREQKRARRARIEQERARYIARMEQNSVNTNLINAIIYFAIDRPFDNAYNSDGEITYTNLGIHNKFLEESNISWSDFNKTMGEFSKGNYKDKEKVRKYFETVKNSDKYTEDNKLKENIDLIMINIIDNGV